MAWWGTGLRATLRPTLLLDLPSLTTIIIATTTLVMGIHVPTARTTNREALTRIPGWALIVTIIASAAWWPTLLLTLIANGIAAWTILVKNPRNEGDRRRRD